MSVKDNIVLGVQHVSVEWACPKLEMKNERSDLKNQFLTLSCITLELTGMFLKIIFVNKLGKVRCSICAIYFSKRNPVAEDLLMIHNVKVVFEPPIRNTILPSTKWQNEPT